MSLTADFVALIESHTGRNGRKVGKEIVLLCPAHDDHDPSLNVKEGREGEPLVRCRSKGCTFEMVCQALGRETKDFLPKRQERLGDPEATYDYTDELGQLLFQVVRFPGKQFRQRKPDGAGGWLWELGDTRRVLYRLPDVVAAVEAGTEIALCEGEKDVASVLKVSDSCPTTNPMGAGKWRDEYTQSLVGARVTIIADKDEAGRSHAWQVAGSLEGKAASVRVLEPPEAKDITEHLAKGGTLRDLIECKGAPGTNGHYFAGLTHDEVLKLEVEGTSCLVDDLVEAGTVGTIAAVPETHKSFIAQAIAVGIARGEGVVLGRPVLVQGPVSYFWSDDSTRNEVERIQDLEQIRSNPPGLPIVWYLNSGLRLPDEIELLRSTIERDASVLAVLDSFYNLALGISLKEEDAAIIVALLKSEICDRTGCTVAIVDHAPWPNEQNRGQHRAYGSVFKGAAIRWGIYPERDGSKLFVSAHGNNIRGIKRTPAFWDEETMEVKLVDVIEVDREEVQNLVLAYVTSHPGEPTSKVALGVEKRRKLVKEALDALGRFEKVFSKRPAEMGRTGRGDYWFPLSDAGFEASQIGGTLQDALDLDVHAD